LPLVITPDDDERAAVIAAVSRIESNKPTNPKLQPRARRGSLRLNLATVETESGISRHRIVTLYEEQADYISEKQPARSEAVPLTRQRDLARQEKAMALRRLQRSQDYSYRLLERLHLLSAERKLLQERIDDLERQLEGEPDRDDIIGTDLVVGTPPVPSVRKARAVGVS
jgi:chromosome segregation ATPase